MGGRAAALAGLLLAVTLACGVEGALGNTAKLQIGVKHRPKECIAKAKAGDSVEVHYTGTLAADGSKFDSSLDRGQPFRFTLGRGQVIKGWDQGIAGMCIGEKRRLKIPSHLGYGDQGSPPKIPGGATLIFETELIGIDGVPSTA